MPAAHGRLAAALALAASVLATSALAPQAAGAAPTPTTIRVDADSQVRGPWLGYGVNWEPEPGGGSNPGTYTDAMAALDARRVDHIKPQLVRVTWLTTGFAPTNTVGSYDWTTTWAKNEFKAMDYLNAHHIPVMVGWWSTPWDATGTDHAQAVADFLDHLINERGYTNIRYWDGINEANHRDPTTYARWKTQVHNIKTRLAARDIDIDILGPGTQDPGPTTDWLTKASTEMTSELNGYDTHVYPTQTGAIANGGAAGTTASQITTADGNDPSSKPFVVEELGDKAGWDSGNDAQPRVTTGAYGLDIADLALQLTRAGVSSPLAWRLNDLGSPKKWGMYNGATGDTALRPWTASWTMLSRAFPAASTLYAPAQPAGVRLLTGKTPNDGWSVAAANRNSTTSTVPLDLPEATSATFDVYQYTDGPTSVDADGFPTPSGQVTADEGQLTLTVPPHSLVVLQTR